MVVSAIVGGAGLVPTMAALRAGKTLALANKETLVMAGALVTAEARARGTRILPVDSEHSAIFQCLAARRHAARSGAWSSRPPAARFGHSRCEAFAAITPEEALQHPTWSMGKKITIDSATLINKGLEVIEAHWLFGLPVGPGGRHRPPAERRPLAWWNTWTARSWPSSGFRTCACRSSTP